MLWETRSGVVLECLGCFVPRSLLIAMLSSTTTGAHPTLSSNIIRRCQQITNTNIFFMCYRHVMPVK